MVFCNALYEKLLGGIGTYFLKWSGIWTGATERIEKISVFSKKKECSCALELSLRFHRAWLRNCWLFGRRWKPLDYQGVWNLRVFVPKANSKALRRRMFRHKLKTIKENEFQLHCDICKRILWWMPNTIAEALWRQLRNPKELFVNPWFPRSTVGECRIYNCGLTRFNALRWGHKLKHRRLRKKTFLLLCLLDNLYKNCSKNCRNSHETITQRVASNFHVHWNSYFQQNFLNWDKQLSVKRVFYLQRYYCH